MLAAFSNYRGKLIPVQLDGVQTDCATQSDDGFGGPIHKNSHGFHIFRQLRNYLPGVGWCEDARTLLVKVKTQGSCSQVTRCFGVPPVGDATDFYANHLAYSAAGAAPRRPASAAAGSPARIRCSPMRKASKPALRRRTRSALVESPDSATAIRSSGMRSISSSDVSTRTSSVFRSRLL